MQFPSGNRPSSLFTSRQSFVSAQISYPSEKRMQSSSARMRFHFVFKAVFERPPREEYGFRTQQPLSPARPGIGGPYARAMPLEACPKGHMVQRNAG